jgi:hypothetical protein
LNALRKPQAIKRTFLGQRISGKVMAHINDRQDKAEENKGDQ